MNKHANECPEFRDWIKECIHKVGGQKEFAKSIGMSHDTLKRKLNRSRGMNGTTAKLSVKDVSKIFEGLFKKPFPWDIINAENELIDKENEYRKKHPGFSDNQIKILVENFKKTMEEIYGES